MRLAVVIPSRGLIHSRTVEAIRREAPLARAGQYRVTEAGAPGTNNGAHAVEVWDGSRPPHVR